MTLHTMTGMHLDDILSELEQGQPDTARSTYSGTDWKGELTLRRVFGPVSIAKVHTYDFLAYLVANPVADETAMRARLSQLLLRSPSLCVNSKLGGSCLNATAEPAPLADVGRGVGNRAGSVMCSGTICPLGRR